MSSSSAEGSERDAATKLICHAHRRVFSGRPMLASDEEKAKARRAIVILYVCMVLA